MGYARRSGRRDPARALQSAARVHALCTAQRQGAAALPARASRLAALAVPPRRTGRDDRGVAVGGCRAVDRCEVLRVDPDDGRGPPRRSLQPLRPHEARMGVSGQRQPEEGFSMPSSWMAAGTSSISACRFSSRAWRWPRSGNLHALAEEPLVKKLLYNVMRDESRHVAFGVLSLDGYYRDLSPSELRDREEFVIEACTLMRDRMLGEEVADVMGLRSRRSPRADLELADHDPLSPAALSRASCPTSSALVC